MYTFARGHHWYFLDFSGGIYWLPLVYWNWQTAKPEIAHWDILGCHVKILGVLKVGILGVRSEDLGYPVKCRNLLQHQKIQCQETSRLT